jgi:hypothetical protein
VPGEGLVIATFCESGDDLRPRPERRCTPAVPAATPEDPDPSLQRAFGHKLGEPRLTDPGLAGEKEQASPAADRVLQGGRQLRHFPIPADEGSRSLQPGSLPELTHCHTQPRPGHHHTPAHNG